MRQSSRAESGAGGDLGELFLCLVDVKRSLWAGADVRLRAERGISLRAVRAMAMVAERDGRCDESMVASDVSLSPEEAHRLVDGLVVSRRLTRGHRCADSGPDALSLTLPGRVELAGAQRALEDELAKRLGAPLAADELARLEDAVAAMLAGVRAAA